MRYFANIDTGTAHFNFLMVSDNKVILFYINL